MKDMHEALDELIEEMERMFQESLDQWAEDYGFARNNVYVTFDILKVLQMFECVSPSNVPERHFKRCIENFIATSTRFKLDPNAEGLNNYEFEDTAG